MVGMSIGMTTLVKKYGWTVLLGGSRFDLQKDISANRLDRKHEQGGIAYSIRIRLNKYA